MSANIGKDETNPLDVELSQLDEKRNGRGECSSLFQVTVHGKSSSAPSISCSQREFSSQSLAVLETTPAHKKMKQVSRTTTTKIAEDEIDPLSAFAQQLPSTPPPVIIRDDADQRDKSEFVTVEKLSMVSAVKKEILPPLSTPDAPPPFCPQKMRLGSVSPVRNNHNEEQQRPGSMRLSSSSNIFNFNNVMPAVKGLSEDNSPIPNSLSASSSNDALASQDDFPFMSGEMKVMSMTHAAVHVIPIGGISGVLYMTNYRVVFLPSQADVDRLRRTSPSFLSWLNVPLACIDRIEREKRPKETPNAGITMMIYCKDCRQLRINIKPESSSNGDYDLERAFSLMNTYAFPNNPRYLFAFNHSIGRFNIGTLQDEYVRMGLYKNQLWRISHANLDFRLCSTYPEDLVVPCSITDEELNVIGAFRSGHRLPVLCWATDRHAASIWRSSQPKAGVSGSCLQDIRLLEVIARSTAVQRQRSSTVNSNDSLLYIVDARSRNSAMANMAAGAGYESQNYYSSSRLDFYNIPNIHAVRDSYKGMLSLVLNPTANPASDISFSKQIEDTSWLTNVRLILKASFETAGFVNKGFPVLVHCSHGWDRTAQITCLAQLFLDPFYRTFEGFPVLIEKEWLAFGHQFQMRCAHGQDKAQRQEQEFSPIFIQFLDCLWQVLNKFGQHFEYNTKYVLTVAEHVYSGRFGTFLFSSELDRRTFQARTHSADLWQYLASNRSMLTNPFYAAVPGVFLPPLGQLLRGVTIWSDYFLRWSSVVSIPSLQLHGDLAEYPGLLRRLDDNDRDQRSTNVTLSNAYDSMMFEIVSTEDYLEAQWAKERFHRLSVERELKESVSRHQRSLEALLKLVRDRVPSELMDELETEIHRMEGEEALTVQEIIATHRNTSSTNISDNNNNNNSHKTFRINPQDPMDSSLTTTGDDEEFQTSSASSSNLAAGADNKELVGSVDEEDMIVMSGHMQLPGHLSSAECIEVLQTAAEVQAEAAAETPLLASPMSPHAASNHHDTHNTIHTVFKTQTNNVHEQEEFFV